MLIVLRSGVVFLDRVRRRAIGGAPRERAVERRELTEIVGVGELEVTELLREVPLGLAGRTLLRRDDDDPRRGLRAIDRRGGRALEDLDALDVIGIEIGDPVRTVVLDIVAHAAVR